MFISARWQRNAVRFVASILFLESALSFAPPTVQRPPALFCSLPLLLPTTGALQRRSSRDGGSFWPARAAVAGYGHRQRRGAASQQTLPLTMSSAAGRNGAAPERGDGTASGASAGGGAVDVADAPDGDAQSSKPQKQVKVASRCWMRSGRQVFCDTRARLLLI